MTSDYDERTSLFAYAGGTHKLVGFTTGWLYPLTQLAAFQDVLQGARIVGCICGSLLIAFCLFTALRLKEPPAETPIIRARNREPFFRAIKVVLSNRVLLSFSAACLLTMTSLYTVSSLGLYINIYHVFGGNKVAAATMMGIWGTTFNALAMISIPGVLVGVATARQASRHHARAGDGLCFRGAEIHLLHARSPVPADVHRAAARARARRVPGVGQLDDG